ncbi:MAG TPA: N-acetylmuramoyl-L-alanine amidase [Pseudomonadales bacterium]|nr:N-acetylmuramoyl-L-alanine amidase [Pseudomonadales bacterium]
MRLIDVPSANQSSRISHLVLHFTSETLDESMRLLTQPSANPVSAHYLLAGPDPATGARPVVYRLVPEARRAWHAGRSAWSGRSALNDSSIGVEIVNLSGCEEPLDGAELPDPATQSCTFEPWPEAQIEVLILLLKDILARNPDIAAENVVGHADIAFARRVDPGPLFPWRRLHEAGIGAWYEEAAVARHAAALATSGLPPLDDLQAALAAWGYGVEVTGEDDAQTRLAVRAFQMHFRPSDHRGRFDGETAAILFALLERYRVEARAHLPHPRCGMRETVCAEPGPRHDAGPPAANPSPRARRPGQPCAERAAGMTARRCLPAGCSTAPGAEGAHA